MPRMQHLLELCKIWDYLTKYPDKRLDVRAEPPTELPGKLISESRETLHVPYPDAVEEIDSSFLEPKGPPISTHIYFDSNHSHDEVT